MQIQRPDKPEDILIVDDTPANLRLLSEMLSERGYRVRAVTSGSLALESVAMLPPQLVLLDIKMPEMDGYAVCRELKSNALTQDIPVIFISALDELEDKVRAFGVGGVDYVTKPFQLEEVLARVRTHLALRRLQEQLETTNQRMARELALAGAVQASFLPSELPRVPGWDVAVTLRPARQTSGDFYDIDVLPNADIVLLMADVVDKGVGAALYMALSWALIGAYAVQFPGQPAMALTATNRRILADTRSEEFVSVFYGALNPASGVLTYCNAGHHPPLLVRAKGTATEALTRTGMVLGVTTEESWKQESVELGPGDVLLLYTDGLTDAQNDQGTSFGVDMLQQVLVHAPRRSASGIQTAVLAAVDKFVGDTEQFDDMALMAVVRQSLRH
jgi:sigma-B regulation protein RsbU (phosphoserine phosphatase)